LEEWKEGEEARRRGTRQEGRRARRGWDKGVAEQRAEEEREEGEGEENEVY